MPRLVGRKILLGVGGSVAAFKAAGLASELTKAGATVRVILTSAGERFVTAETFRDLTDQPVATSLWDAEIDHIDLVRWADAIVVAPATANLIARYALGLADDLLSTVLLASSIPVLLAPAMESHMWDSPATRRNVAELTGRGVTFAGPVAGRLASGTVGAGRMLEPTEICRKVVEQLLPAVSASKGLRGVKVVVTAGPSQEPIDPVRYISNRSSGKMGYEVAMAAERSGATVTLISGPVDQALKAALPGTIELVDVTTAADMLEAVMVAAETADVVIMAAAVADFRPLIVGSSKIKKDAGMDTIALEPTDDILATLAERDPRAIRIGFAAETDDLLANAQSKLEGKGLAMIVANDVSGRTGEVFGADENEVTILRPGVKPETLPRLSKREVADHIVAGIAALRTDRGSAG